MQINLQHHPDAFASLDAAFDPATNTAYAGRFLWRLFARTGTWPHAAAAYHSQTPQLAAPYAARVMALWAGAGRYGDMASGAVDLDRVYTPSFRAKLAADEAFHAAHVAAMYGRKPAPTMALAGHPGVIGGPRLTGLRIAGLREPGH